MPRGGCFILQTLWGLALGLDYMKINGILVDDLFRRASQMPTAMKICSSSWSPSTYITLLNTIVKARKPLHQDTVRALQGPLRHLHNPLQRRVCLDLIEKLGPVDPKVVFESARSTEDFEEAVLAQSDPDSLLHLGDFHGLKSRLAKGWKPSVYLWCEIFTYFVDQHDFDSAKYLWSLRPSVTIGPAPSTAVLSQFLSLASMYDDLPLLLEIGKELGNEPLSRSTATALLNAASKQPIADLLQTLSMFAGLNVLKSHDCIHVGEILARNVLLMLDHPAFNYDVHGNVLLAGLFRANSSQTVFHVYRMLVNKGFNANAETAQILANAAYRLGNSKLLALEIWKELALERNVPVSRGVCETLLLSQLVGPKYHSVFYFLRQMREQKVFLRQHIQRRLYNMFEAVGDNELVKMFTDLRLLDKYTLEKAGEVALEESQPREQAIRNAQVFTEGMDSSRDAGQVLEEMLEFDRKRNPTT